MSYKTFLNFVFVTLALIEGSGLDFEVDSSNPVIWFLGMLPSWKHSAGPSASELPSRGTRRYKNYHTHIPAVARLAFPCRFFKINFLKLVRKSYRRLSRQLSLAQN
jgi:hypothetical protein